MTAARVFRGFRFPAEVILRAVRWYLQFPISYRDLEAMLGKRGRIPGGQGEARARTRSDSGGMTGAPGTPSRAPR